MRKEIKKIGFGAALVILLLVLGVWLFYVIDWSEFFLRGKKSVMTSSTLKEMINVSEFSSSKFTYNGIATLYEDETQEEIKCQIRYNATVKAGIDLGAVSFRIDDEAKMIRPILPKITITSNTVDEKTLSFIPSNTEIELKDALLACQNDALREAQKSDELLHSAKENLQSIIEALLLPLVHSHGYTISWN